MHPNLITDVEGSSRKWEAQGLRAELRNRLLADENLLEDNEILQSLIHTACPEMRFAKANRVATAAIEKFGSFGSVLSTAANRLTEIPDFDSRAALAVEVTAVVAHNFLKSRVQKASRATSLQAIKDYLFAQLVWQDVETFCVIHLNKRKHAISYDMLSTGTLTHVPVYPREVTTSAIKASANYVILIHNHPSGDPTPSRDDILMTRQVCQALKVVNISVYDHLIFGRRASVSFLQEGLL